MTKIWIEVDLPVPDRVDIAYVGDYGQAVEAFKYEEFFSGWRDAEGQRPFTMRTSKIVGIGKAKE